MKEPDKFSAADVFDKIGWEYNASSTRKNLTVICPNCNEKNFDMNMEKNFGHCWGCGYKANQVRFYADVCGVTTKDATKEMLSYKGYAVGGEVKYSKPQAPKKMEYKVEVPSVSLEVLDKTYVKYMSCLPLIESHQKELLSRGLTVEEIKRIGYRSNLNKDLFSIPKRLIDEGFDLKGVPGFHICDREGSKKGLWQQRWLKQGILIPYYNSRKQLQGFQIRKDNALIKHWTDKKTGKKKTEKKCYWFSSNDELDGCSSKGYTHYATEFRKNFVTGEIKASFLSGIAYLTEGGMKADIIHCVTGKNVIAVPGVSNLVEFEKELPILKELGVKKIIDIFDMDYLTNPNVAQSCEKVKNMVTNSGLEYERHTWDVTTPKQPEHKELKGYDDYVVYHFRGV